MNNRISVYSTLAKILLLGILGLSIFTLAACQPHQDGSEPPGDTPMDSVKPTWDWGYPEYSEYSHGKHVGKTLYQLDPACQDRLTFYSCDAIDAKTPNNPTTNPTGASVAMTGGLDMCTSAIVDEVPSYCMPADVCNPTQQNFAWAPGQASNDNLSWQLFIAANWPADTAQPGYPDTTLSLGATEAMPSVDHAKTVWLDYPNPEALFGETQPCGGNALTMTSKFSSDFLQADHPSTNLLGGAITQPGGGVLIDQNNNVVYTEIRVNRTQWEFIVNQNDYWKTGTSLAALKPDVQRDYSKPPGQTPGAFPAAIEGEGATIGDVGSMEIKAAWKKLTQDEIEAGKFFTRTFTLYEADGVPGEQCVENQTMGLIGMHIVYMPASFGNPDWVWATFEHRLNVPTTGINDGETEFSLSNPNCTTSKTPAECAAFDAKKDQRADFACCPNLKLYSSASDLPTDSKPLATQVTRLTNPTVSTILPTRCTEYHTQSIEKNFGSDNVWGNYFLVSTQWPLRGSDTNFPAYDPVTPANFPCLMRNSTLETFHVNLNAPALNGCQDRTQDPFCRSCNGDCVADAADANPCLGYPATEQLNTSDCMGCHGKYASHNSSFIFSHRPCCVMEDGSLPNSCGVESKQASCEATAGCTWVSSDPACSG